MVFPAREDNYRISDPFGFGFSNTLFRAYQNLREKGGDEHQFILGLREEAETKWLYQPKAVPGTLRRI